MESEINNDIFYKLKLLFYKFLYLFLNFLKKLFC